MPIDIPLLNCRSLVNDTFLNLEFNFFSSCSSLYLHGYSQLHLFLPVRRFWYFSQILPTANILQQLLNHDMHLSLQDSPIFSIVRHPTLLGKKSHFFVPPIVEFIFKVFFISLCSDFRSFSTTIFCITSPHIFIYFILL